MGKPSLSSILATYCGVIHDEALCVAAAKNTAGLVRLVLVPGSLDVDPADFGQSMG